MHSRCEETLTLDCAAQWSPYKPCLISKVLVCALCYSLLIVHQKKLMKVCRGLRLQVLVMGIVLLLSILSYVKYQRLLFSRP